MSRFFHFFAVLCAVLLVAALTAGMVGVSPSQHLLLGLAAGLCTVSLHCLVFGIFTGAGKDTRELVQDLRLDKTYTEKTKSFRKVAFPPALYAIMLIMATTTAGGALSAFSTPVARWAHFLLAWFTLLYNFKAFWVEAKCVRENARILDQVNRVAMDTIASRPEEGKAIPEISGVISAATEQMEWGSHVYALGKFLVFLGWNTWLPFIYIKYIMGYSTTPVWPFLGLFLVSLAGGYYLRWQYQAFRPDRLSHSVSA